MTDMPPEVIERAERRVDAIFAKVIGGVLLWVGVAFSGLFVWAAHAVVILGRPLNAFALVMLGVFAVVATFSVLVGWRLFLNRPNRYGSILSPTSWRVLGTMFGAMGAAGLIISVVLLRDGLSSDEALISGIAAAVFCAMLCHWCFLAARRAVANVTR